MGTPFYLGIIFTLGALTEWLSPKVGLPKVVGYLLLGLIIGPEMLGIVPSTFLNDTHVVTDLALALIAVMVGANIQYGFIKKLGKQAFIITLLEGLFAFLFVAFGIYLFSSWLGLEPGQSLVFAILFGGLSAATAPAATIATVHENQAKGRFTSMLLVVVASDDALALVFFALAITFGTAFVENAQIGLGFFVEAVTILFGSIVVGTIGAVLSVAIDKLFAHHHGMETISTLGMIFIVYALSNAWSLEPLLAALAMGAAMINISKDFQIVEEEIDNHLEEIIFMLFFILSAMHLDLQTLTAAPLLILAYVLLRFLGKYWGAWCGAKLSGADRFTRTYLGLGLFPQAGVAIGLALSLQNESILAGIAPLILNVIIASTIIHELIGPLFIKYILKKSGECSEG